ncbi:Yct1 protein [Martiniozyma asiatica (nom. inval.)]|nr:Yct1 protein [Martiniozyma asiatica]
MSSQDSVNSTSVEKTPEINATRTSQARVVTSRDADITLEFLSQHDADVAPITPEQEKRLSRKNVAIILSLTAFTNLLLYSDKATLSYASIFSLWEDTHMTQNKYNNSSTLFYVGYMIGQLNLIAVQKLPIGRLMTFLTFIWSVILFLHCTAHSYQGIYALRFFLGFVESIAVPILNTTMGQFLTAKEKAATAPLFYSTCVGVTIPVGFIAYGILYAHSTVPTWKLFFIIIAGCTFLWSIVVFFIYPNNPTDAVFLNKEEKVWTIRRVQKTTGAGIEQKVVKRYQIFEALRDPISWLFALFFLLQQLANNLPYQQNLLFEGIGNINNLDSTLVSVASGGFAAICCFIATTFLFFFENYTAFSVVFWTLPSFAGSIAVATLPWDNKIALLAMLCLASPLFGIPWILMFSWNTTSCSGYTKKLTRNAMVMVAYGIANIISPQLWQEKDGPRYLPAWIVQIVLSFFIAPLLALVIWFILNRRNNARKEAIASDSDSAKGFVTEENGEEVEVNIALLDLTDLENDKFIYPL